MYKHTYVYYIIWYLSKNNNLFKNNHTNLVKYENILYPYNDSTECIFCDYCIIIYPIHLTLEQETRQIISKSVFFFTSTFE